MNTLTMTTASKHHRDSTLLWQKAPVQTEAVCEVTPVERVVYQHGSSPDSYLITEPDYEHFWDDQKTGCVGYLRDRHYLHIVGGLSAPEDRKLALLQQFTEFTTANKYLPSFFSIPEADLGYFQQCGYQVTKFGENTAISLKNHSWQGKSYSWIRRQMSYVTRQGAVAREILLDQLSAEERKAVFQQVHHINHEHLSQQLINHELRLLEGQVYPDQFYRRRLFVAHRQETPDHWEAYVVCTPMHSGQGWATEMYRSRNDAIRGVTPFLIASLINQLQQESRETISLCMIPALHCQTPLPGDNRLVRFLLGIWEKRLNFLFNVQGLLHFKSRFRPEFTPVYLCVRPRATVGSVFSFMKTIGFFELDYLHAFRHVAGSRKKKQPADAE